MQNIDVLKLISFLVLFLDNIKPSPHITLLIFVNLFPYTSFSYYILLLRSVSPTLDVV
jgi:hypothetical protein